ncbi:MAG TPA: tyrosine-type recombinase/integrase [Pirellulales bacterium]
MKAWLFQDKRQLAELGDKCPWSVGWYADGKQRRKIVGSKTAAERFARRTEGQLEAGSYVQNSRRTWKDFRKAFDAKILAAMEPNTKRTTQTSLKHFERIVRPGKLVSLTTDRIADYAAARRLEKRTKREDAPAVSPATVNRELRTIRATRNIANEWGWLPKRPKVRLLREPVKLPTYVDPETFAKLYAACDDGPMLDLPGVAAADWWRGLLVMAYMTGWRISELLKLRREDVNFENATALNRAADNKGRRDSLTLLHPIVVDHLKPLAGFSRLIFAWPHDQRTLWVEFYRLQTAAKVKPDGKAHYGFHDLRRAFATMNAANMTVDASQLLMRHKSYTTTQRYIAMSRQVNPAVAALFVPELKTASGA